MGLPVCNSTREDMRLTEFPVAHGVTVHEIFLLIAGLSTIIAVLLSIFQIFKHGSHYLRPEQQRHVVRILFMVPVYSVSNFLAAFYYTHEIYFILVGNAYAAFGLASFFSLLSHYVASDLHHQKQYFRTLKPKPWGWPMSWLQKCFGGERGCLRTPRSGLTYFNVVFVGVFQYCFVLVAMSITGSVTHVFQRYCPASLSPAFAHIWIIIFNTASAIISSYCLAQYHKQLSADVKHWKTKFQYSCINIVLYLSTYQTLLIAILVNTGAIKASDYLQMTDLKVVLPATILCVEMAVVSILHLFAYSSKPYVISSKEYNAVTHTEVYGDIRERDGYQGGTLGWKALADALNPWDLVKAVGRAANFIFHGYRYRRTDSSYEGSQLPNNKLAENPAVFSHNSEGDELLAYKPSAAPAPSHHYSSENVQPSDFHITYQDPYLSHPPHHHYHQPGYGYYWGGDLADQRLYSH